MRAGIQEETLRAMLEAGAVREVLVSRQDDKWGLAIRLGGAGSRWLEHRLHLIFHNKDIQGLSARTVMELRARATAEVLAAKTLAILPKVAFCQ